MLWSKLHLSWGSRGWRESRCKQTGRTLPYSCERSSKRTALPLLTTHKHRRSFQWIFISIEFNFNPRLIFVEDSQRTAVFVRIPKITSPQNVAVLIANFQLCNVHGDISISLWLTLTLQLNLSKSSTPQNPDRKEIVGRRASSPFGGFLGLFQTFRWSKPDRIGRISWVRKSWWRPGVSGFRRHRRWPCIRWARKTPVVVGRQSLRIT